MTAAETWTLAPVAHRGGVVDELDIKAECDDGRRGIITMRRFPGGGWLAPLHLHLPPKIERLALKIAREAVSA